MGSKINQYWSYVVTSTGHYIRPVLLRTVTSTASLTDQYWFTLLSDKGGVMVSLSHRSMRYQSLAPLATVY